MSDTGRAAVYAAELAAFDGTSFESRVTLDVLQSMAARLFASSWWPGGAVPIVPARANANSSSARQRGSTTPQIRLAGPQLTAATLVHELAHVLAGVGAGHSARFRRAHIDIAGALLGPEPAGWLVDAYAAMGLDVGAREWADPAA